MPRVYFPVESLVGLGHFNRAGKIVRSMIASGYDVTVVSGSFEQPEKFFEGARLINLPEYRPYRGRDYERANSLQWRADRCASHRQLISDIKPDVLLTEFWPFDRTELDDEMHAMIQEADKVSPHCLKCVSVRDIIEVPKNGSREELEKRDQRALEIINKHFQAVLVHGDPGFVPLDETFPLVDQIKAKVVYTGYVVDDLPQRTVPINGLGPLLVSCGSGAAADEMLYSFIKAWNRLVENSSHDTEAKHVTDRPVTIVTGPRFGDVPFEMLTCWAKVFNQGHQGGISKEPPFDKPLLRQLLEWTEGVASKNPGQKITVERSPTDYKAQLGNCAFSISSAGYNTTLETLAMRVPALFVPLFRYDNGQLTLGDEQFYRLERLREKGLVSYVRPDEVQDADGFASIITKEFIAQTANAKPKSGLNFDGAENTVKVLQELSGGCRSMKTYAPSLPVGSLKK